MAFDVLTLLMTFSQVLGSLFMRNLSKLCLFLVPLHLCWIKLQTINNMLFEFWMQSDSLGFFLFLSPYKFITSVLTLMKNIIIIIFDCSTITKWLQWLVRWCKVIVGILVKIVSGYCIYYITASQRQLWIIRDKPMTDLADETRHEASWLYVCPRRQKARR